MDAVVADRQHTQSRLPTYREADLRLKSSLQALVAVSPVEKHGHSSFPANTDQTPSAPAPAPAPESPLLISAPPTHTRTQSTNDITTTKKTQPPKPERSASVDSPQRTSFKVAHSPSLPHLEQQTQAQTKASSNPPHPDTTQNISLVAAKNKPRNPGTHSRNGLEGGTRPPRAMITQRSSYSYTKTDNSSTTDWVAQQSLSISPTTIANQHSPTTSTQPQPQTSRAPASVENTPARPLIKPIRGFKPSSRKSVEMASHRYSVDRFDPDSTIRAYGGGGGYGNSSRPRQHEPEEQHSDDSDLFLRAARDEELARPSHEPMDRSDFRRTRTTDRESLPPSTTQLHHPMSRRQGSEESSNGNRSTDEQHEGIPKALTYRPTRDRPAPLEDTNRTRYMNTRSNPTTPRTRGSREISPESPGTYSGRRPSAPDVNLPARTYRSSNLSYSTARVYNSSPLVSRTADIHDAPETAHAAGEGTASTVSTTAPSTVWDELEDLKSRIHRLELTGKLPPTSGAAISRASNERPPTATTTVTTMSSSPKRGRGNSLSPIEPTDLDSAPAPPESHPLLRAALVKSKTLLNEDIYKALEATASDALTIAEMMGTSGQPGPISSAQSTVGGPAAVSDRQVRRKVDSMCRSLTELCLALSEGKNELPALVVKEKTPQPAMRDTDIRPSIETNNDQRQNVSTDLVRVKPSPRALSRLEARRSSLLITSSMPSPRQVSDAPTPTQTTMTGRRSSLLLRSRRAGTEEAEEEDSRSRFRVPSRANTEIGRARGSREYTSQQPLPERPAVVQSSLPVRRHYTSTSLTNNPVTTPPVSMLGGRRFLERATPERETSSSSGRLGEERGQRKGSVGSQFAPLGRTGSLNRRLRQSSVAES